MGIFRKDLRKEILELIEEGKLTIGFVKINDDNKEDMKDYSRDILPHKGKNIS